MATFIADMSANAEKIANEISDNAWIADMNYKANKALEKQLKEAEQAEEEKVFDVSETENAEKLNDLRSVEGSLMDQYINISATNVKAASCTYFIRKASGTKVSGYNIYIHLISILMGDVGSSL